MKRTILLWLVLILAGSCRQEKKIPADILSQQRMKLVLWDMMRADEFLLNYAAKDSGFHKKDESLQLYAQVYSIHKTTKTQFEKSLAFYKVHPDLFKVVLDSIEKMKTRILEQQYRRNSADSAKKRIRLNSRK